MSAGAAVNLGRLDCSLHTGTHADAPFHVLDGAATAEALDPALFLGPCLVVRLSGSTTIDRRTLEASGVCATGNLPDRLLIAAGPGYDGTQFPDQMPAIAPGAAEWLAAEGVRLVGVNQPSIDPPDSTSMDAHRALFAAKAVVLENLDLRQVAGGDYELIAAPLAIHGADAAPVRALLRPVPRA